MSNQVNLKTESELNVVEALSVLLADSYGLYLKTQNYHWNVTGSMFQSLHTLFQAQYEELALIVDEIAERIRALGEKAPGSYTAFAKLSTILDETGSPKAMEMIKNLVEDQNKIIESAKLLLEIAGKNNDEPSIGLAVARIELHEKSRWMLQAHLEG